MAVGSGGEPDRAARQRAAIEAFRALHQAGCFVLPNPWDVGSAVLLERLGFRALASTSAGFAFTLGLPDEVGSLSRDVVLAHLSQLAAATALPVNADYQEGYAVAPEEVADNVTRCVATGVAGLSIEDATGDPVSPLHPTALAVERVRAARAAIDQTGIPVLLTARCEAWLVGHPEARQLARERLVAFAEAGADCLFAPGVREVEAIAELVRAVAPLPVNVLVSSANRELTVAQLADLGVRRVSVGAALARVAWGAFLRAAREIAETGAFDLPLDGAAPFDELNGVFLARTQRSR